MKDKSPQAPAVIDEVAPWPEHPRVAEVCLTSRTAKGLPRIGHLGTPVRDALADTIEEMRKAPAQTTSDKSNDPAV